MNNFNWKIINNSKNSQARTGVISTPHGEIYTPAFIFCGTKAALKSISTEQAKMCGTQIILSNTFHLMLQPGGEIISQHGGIHKFMNWGGPMLTDSGGYQIFSFGHGSVSDEIKKRSPNKNQKKSLIKIIEEGAIFKSYFDGSDHLLSPEKSIEIQRKIGADIILVFDECTPFNVDKSYTAESMQRSHRWSNRSINSFHSSNTFKSCHGSSGKQVLYGIIQGGVYDDLREESIEFNLKTSDFFGLAIGGSLGSTKQEMYKIVQYTANKLEDSKPVHLLGIGDPTDIFTLVKSGIDTFDCVSPTRLARHGAALIRTKLGKINIKNSEYKNDTSSIDEKCQCNTCKNYSKAYLHHLFKADEILGLHLLTVHNVYFMNFLMSYLRNAINSDDLEDAEKNWFLD